MSASDILESSPEMYTQTLIEAFSIIAPEKDLRSVPCSRLVGGLSKAMLFRVDVEDKKYVVRLLDPRKPVERRQSELRAHTLGDELCIAPHLVYADHTPLVMVMEFIQGRTLSREDLDDRVTMKKVMHALRKFHNSVDRGQWFSRSKAVAIRDSYQKYKKKGAIYPSCFDALHEKLQHDLAQVAGNRLPSHGDLNPGNILLGSDGQVYFIDWSEAGLDAPYLDIGWLACFAAATENQMRDLLFDYLEREPTQSEMREVRLFRDTTTFLVATLWIGRQEESERCVLDALLQGSIKTGSDYIREGVTTEQISQKTGADLTVYSLGWLKDFLLARSSNAGELKGN